MSFHRTLLLTFMLWASPTLGMAQQALTAPPQDWWPIAQDLERRDHWGALVNLGLNWTRSEANNPLAWFVLGRAYGALARYPEAIAAYRQNLALDPSDSYAHNNLGNVYYTLGRYRDALDAYHDAVRSNPDYLLAWRNLGQMYYLLKGPAGVAQALRQLQATDPTLALAWARLATTYSMSRSARVEQQAIQVLRGLSPEQRERMFAILLAEFQPAAASR